MEPLAQKLQTVGVSIPYTKSMIASLQSVLDQNRMDFTTVASNYDEACAVVGTEELSMPRVAGRQVRRDNLEAESASQYYQRLIFLSYIDGIISSSLRERFNDNPSFFALLSILPSNDPSNIDQIESLYSLGNLANEVRLYRNSLTAQVNQESLSEFLLSVQAYLSVRNIIQIIMSHDTVEAERSTVEAERSFLCMKRVKTYLSSAMASDCLSDLCVPHCHYERLDDEKANRILATIAGEKRRRLDF